MAEYDLVLCGFFGVWVGFVGLDHLVGGLIWVFALICACVFCFGFCLVVITCGCCILV